MGGGKESVEFLCVSIRPGRIIFELEGLSEKMPEKL